MEEVKRRRCGCWATKRRRRAGVLVGWGVFGGSSRAMPLGRAAGSGWSLYADRTPAQSAGITVDRAGKLVEIEV